MRKIVVTAVSLLIVCAFAVQAGAETKKVYVRAFASGDGVYGTGMADEIKDCMCEVLVKKLSLITDDEVREYLSNAELVQSVSADAENASA